MKQIFEFLNYFEKYSKNVIIQRIGGFSKNQ